MEYVVASCSYDSALLFVRDWGARANCGNVRFLRLRISETMPGSTSAVATAAAAKTNV
jgi:hypothetical protein